jgi:hypothetical protein
MKDKPLFYPFQREHNDLNKVAEGRDKITIDPEKIKTMVDVEEDGILYGFAVEMYESELQGQSPIKTYVNILEPALHDGIWVIKKQLTSQGENILEALKAGLIWNVPKGQSDIPATIAYYEGMMTKGQIEMRFVDLLLETKTEELRELRNKLVYFKLRGQRRDDIIIGAVDAT